MELTKFTSVSVTTSNLKQIPAFADRGWTVRRAATQITKIKNKKKGRGCVDTKQTRNIHLAQVFILFIQLPLFIPSWMKSLLHSALHNNTKDSPGFYFHELHLIQPK